MHTYIHTYTRTHTHAKRTDDAPLRLSCSDHGTNSIYTTYTHTCKHAYTQTYSKMPVALHVFFVAQDEFMLIQNAHTYTYIHAYMHACKQRYIRTDSNCVSGLVLYCSRHMYACIHVRIYTHILPT